MVSAMSFKLPPSLATDSDASAIRALQKYYFTPKEGPGFFTGSLFDSWDPSGWRARDRNRFTADDVVAVTLLSVSLPGEAAHDLLVARTDEFQELLIDLGDDRDLVDIDDLPEGWTGWDLMLALRSLPGVGPTTASKLLARKRPRLRPIWDSVVAQATGTTEQLWIPLWEALRREDRELHARLLRLRDEAGLSDNVSALRVFDVIAWMDGKGY